MESQYQKWVNLSYLAVAALFGYIFFSVTGKVVAAYDLETKVRNIELILRGIDIGGAALIFYILYKNDQVNQFMHEVMAELVRITWPTAKDTSTATVVVIIMVVISGIILGFLDYCWIQLMKWIL